MVILRGLGKGSSEPRSPRQAPCQGHNTEDKEPRALPQRAVSTRLAGARPTSSNTPLCSGHGTPAGCSSHPCGGHPTPSLVQQPGP